MKKKPIIFLQWIDPYKIQVMVGAGAEKQDIIEFSKKNKYKKEFIEWVNSDKIFNFLKGKAGAYCWAEDKNEMLKFNLILLDNYQDTWEYWECLIHELHHLVHRVSKDKMLENEMEAQAYLMEFLFQQIRQKLQIKIEKL